jgi:hypothetical protein
LFYEFLRAVQTAVAATGTVTNELTALANVKLVGRARLIARCETALLDLRGQIWQLD